VTLDGGEGASDKTVSAYVLAIFCVASRILIQLLKSAKGTNKAIRYIFNNINLRQLKKVSLVNNRRYKPYKKMVIMFISTRYESIIQIFFIHYL